MKIATRAIGAWAGVLFSSTGLGMLIAAIGTRHMSPQAWASAAAVDLATWCALGGILLAAGICLITIVRWPRRK
jgi:hypothetical protein